MLGKRMRDSKKKDHRNNYGSGDSAAAFESGGKVARATLPRLAVAILNHDRTMYIIRQLVLFVNPGLIQNIL